MVSGNRLGVELAAGGSVGLSRGPKAGKLQYWYLSPVLPHQQLALQWSWDDQALTSKLWDVGKREESLVVGPGWEAASSKVLILASR